MVLDKLKASIEGKGIGSSTSSMDFWRGKEKTHYVAQRKPIGFKHVLVIEKMSEKGLERCGTLQLRAVKVARLRRYGHVSHFLNTYNEDGEVNSNQAPLSVTGLGNRVADVILLLL